VHQRMNIFYELYNLYTDASTVVETMDSSLKIIDDCHSDIVPRRVAIENKSKPLIRSTGGDGTIGSEYINPVVEVSQTIVTAIRTVESGLADLPERDTT